MEKELLFKIIPVKRMKALITLLIVITLVFGNTATAHAGSYTSKSFSYSRDIVIGSTTVVTITENVIVWFYTDGKVHIYSQSISYNNLSPLASIYLYTPTVTNTDGSYSQTVGNVDLYYLGTTYYIACVATIYNGSSSPALSIF
jgi:membrane-bound acyltransferase YfiQ involved in biofilm formation